MQSYDPLGGLGIGHRLFRLKVRNLSLVRGWRKDSASSVVTGNFNLNFSGIAQSLKDGVRPLGSTEIIRQFSLIFRPDSDSAANWSDIKQMTQGPNAGVDNLSNETKLTRILRAQREAFDETPPTAHLIYSSAAPDFQIKEGWHLQCEIPQIILDQIAEDWENGLQEINLSIDWKFGLIDDQDAPSFVPANWVPIRLKEDANFEQMRGWVSDVSWTPIRKLRSDVASNTSGV